MNEDKGKFLNTLDEMEIDMPKMSEQKIQRILKLELEKAGLATLKTKSKPSYYKPKFKMLAGLVAVGLVFTLCLTTLKESNINIAVNPNGIHGTTITDPIDPNNNGPITTTDNMGSTCITHVEDNSITEILSELSYSVSLPTELTDNYDESVEIKGKELSISFKNSETSLLLKTIPANETIGTASVSTSGFELLTINDYRVKIYGAKNNYTRVEWKCDDINYSLTSKGLSKDKIIKIIESLKKIK